MGEVTLTPNGERLARLSIVVLCAALLSCASTSGSHDEQHSYPQTGARGAVTLAIVGATVVHPGAGVDTNQTILIAGDRIVRVGDGLAAPRESRVVDARGKWVIPGLIDSHVHFFQSGNPFTRPDVADFTDVVPYAQEVARNKARLAATFKVWLASGVTGVADVGGPMWNFEVRDAAQRTAAAPHVKIAGPLVSLVDRKKLELDDPPIIKVTSPDEARALVARELPRQPDYIKVWFIHRKDGNLAAEEEIVRAAGDAAHAAGLRLIVHATELETAKAALRAGADVLVHSVMDAPVDDEFLTLARSRQALYIPTLWVSAGYGAVLSEQFEPTAEERRLADPQVLATMTKLPRPNPNPAAAGRAISSVAMENVKKVWDAGIVVAMGTDAGNIGTLHGPSVFREMELMRKAGLTPAQVLQSATRNGARMLDMEADLGDVLPGKLADLVILDADPLAELTNLSRIHRIVRGGQLLDPDELLRSIR